MKTRTQESGQEEGPPPAHTRRAGLPGATRSEGQDEAEDETPETPSPAWRAYIFKTFGGCLLARSNLPTPDYSFLRPQDRDLSVRFEPIDYSNDRRLPAVLDDAMDIFRAIKRGKDSIDATGMIEAAVNLDYCLQRHRFEEHVKMEPRDSSSLHEGRP